MTSWMEERDRLVAQTQAFVQQVAAAHPKDSARPPVELPPIETAAVETAVIKAATPVPASPAPADAAPMAVAAAPVRFVAPVASERSDIQARVAAFRARQARMNEEREAYNQTMQAKIRKQLGNEAGASRL